MYQLTKGIDDLESGVSPGSPGGQRMVEGDRDGINIDSDDDSDAEGEAEQEIEDNDGKVDAEDNPIADGRLRGEVGSGGADDDDDDDEKMTASSVEKEEDKEASSQEDDEGDSNFDDKNTKDEGDESSLPEKLRPLLNILFPDNAIDGEGDKHRADGLIGFIDDESTLLQFFEQYDVKNLRDLGMFDYDHLSMKMESKVMQYRLAPFCEYIAAFGSKALRKKLKRSATRELVPWCSYCSEFCDNCRMKSNLHGEESCRKRHQSASLACAPFHYNRPTEFRYGIPSEKSRRSQACWNEIKNKLSKRKENHQKDDFVKGTTRGRLSLELARKILASIFAGGEHRSNHPADLIIDPQEQQTWIDEEALDLLDLYPSLAHEGEVIDIPQQLDSKESEVPRSFRVMPFFRFVFGGFEDIGGVLQKVFRYNPRIPLSEARTMIAAVKERNQQEVPAEIIWRLSCFFPGLVDDVQSFLGDTIGRFVIRHKGTWEMDASRVDVLGMMLPRVECLVCLVPSWTLDGWTRFMACLLTCSPKLRSLALLLPVNLVNSQQLAKEALKGFFQEVNASILKEISLKVPEESITFDACSSSYKEISAGLAARVHSSSISSSSSLNPLPLVRLEIYHSFLDEDGANALFSNGDIFKGFDVQMHQPRVIPPGNTYKNIGGPGRATLGLQGFGAISEEGWKTMWEKCSKSCLLEQVLYSPGKLIDRWVALPMDYIGKMRALVTLCIFAHANEGTVDITGPLTSLLGEGGHPATLEFLQVEGSHQDDDGDIGCLAYSIDLRDFCDCLQDNTTLQFLFLNGVEFTGGANVSKSFLKVLQDYNNTTIEFMDICTESHFITIIPKDSWRRDVNFGFTYESYPEAWQIYYLTCFNRFGRGKVQDKNTSLKELVDLLAAVHARVDIDPEEEEFHQSIIAMALEMCDCGDDPPMADFIEMYELLRETPERWCNAVKRHLEATSIKFGLLRESPELWCASAHQGEYVHGRKRKRVN